MSIVLDVHLRVLDTVERRRQSRLQCSAPSCSSIGKEQVEQ
jgi:hypothetical protein